MLETNNPIKVCVFCGKRPESKTKEHIIPKWLIELTGDLNRVITLGISGKHLNEKDELKEMKISFNSFQFPACKKCNEDFGHLENITKPIIQKILSDEYLSILELDVLLDWFDKVRVGLWLGYLILEKVLTSVRPKFHITQRIGDKDRSLVVYKFNDNLNGIQFGGANISNDFIYSKNLGFPYPQNVSMDKAKDGFLIDFEKGTCKINNKPFRVPFLKGGIEIYQPIIQKEAIALEPERYDNEYVLRNTLKDKPMHGVIFLRERDKIQKIEEYEELLLTPSTLFDRDAFMGKFTKHLINMQIHILTFGPLMNNDINKKLLNSITKGQKKLASINRLK